MKTSNPALQRSVNSHVWRLSPPAELWRLGVDGYWK